MKTALVDDSEDGGNANGGKGLTGEGALFSTKVKEGASVPEGVHISKSMGAVAEMITSLGTGK